VINPQSVPEVRSSPGTSALFVALGVGVIFLLSLGCVWALSQMEAVKVELSALIDKCGSILVLAGGLAALFIVILGMGLLAFYLIVKVSRAPVFRALGRHFLLRW
jgi:uncharacterized membrane protein